MQANDDVYIVGRPAEKNKQWLEMHPCHEQLSKRRWSPPHHNCLPGHDMPVTSHPPCKPGNVSTRACNPQATGLEGWLATGSSLVPHSPPNVASFVVCGCVPRACGSVACQASPQAPPQLAQTQARVQPMRLPLQLCAAPSPLWLVGLLDLTPLGEGLVPTLPPALPPTLAPVRPPASADPMPSPPRMGRRLLMLLRPASRPLALPPPLVSVSGWLPTCTMSSPRHTRLLLLLGTGPVPTLPHVGMPPALPPTSAPAQPPASPDAMPSPPHMWWRLLMLLRPASRPLALPPPLVSVSGRLPTCAMPSPQHMRLPLLGTGPVPTLPHVGMQPALPPTSVPAQPPASSDVMPSPPHLGRQLLMHALPPTLVLAQRPASPNRTPSLPHAGLPLLGAGPVPTLPHAGLTPTLTAAAQQALPLQRARLPPTLPHVHWTVPPMTTALCVPPLHPTLPVGSCCH